MRVIAAFALVPLLFAASIQQNELRWRADYENSLKAPDGWLAVAGLFWLHEGANPAGSGPNTSVKLPAPAPPDAGAFRLERRRVTWIPAHGDPAVMQPDTTDHPTVVHIANLELTVIRRSDRFGIRLRDPNAATRLEFTGTSWFPPDPSWIVKAKWVPLSPAKRIAIMNILGMTDEEDCPGYAEWIRSGKAFRLEPVVEDNQLFFMFKDSTNRATTYPAGRFLYADPPKDGVVTLDFNHAHNPPCAFTAYATCPLPPRQNRLPFAVEAGEKVYGHHGTE